VAPCQKRKPGCRSSSKGVARSPRPKARPASTAHRTALLCANERRRDARQQGPRAHERTAYAVTFRVRPPKIPSNRLGDDVCAGISVRKPALDRALRFVEIARRDLRGPFPIALGWSRPSPMFSSERAAGTCPESLSIEVRFRRLAGFPKPLILGARTTPGNSPCPLAVLAFFGTPTRSCVARSAFISISTRRPAFAEPLGPSRNWLAAGKLETFDARSLMRGLRPPLGTPTRANASMRLLPSRLCP